MSTEVGAIHYDLDLNTDKFDKASANISNKLGSLSKKLTAFGVVAGAAVVAFGISAVKSFEDSENAAAQLDAVLKSTGGSAGVTAEMANGLASELQKVTKYSDEAVLGAENMLLTFTNIGKDVFPDATKAVADMATAMGTDLTQTAIQVGKALQDPVQGVTALQRVGVRLSDTQKDLVQHFIDVGDKASAQRVILKELRTEFGGSAEAAGKTFAGQLAILNNQFDDIKENIGKTIVDVLIPLAKWLAELFNKFSKLNPAVQKSAIVFGLIGAALIPVVLLAGALATAIAAISLPVIGVIAAIGALAGALWYLENRFHFVTNSIDFLRPYVLQLVEVFQTYLLPVLQKTWDFMVAQFKPAWEQLKDAFERVRQALEPFMPQLIFLAKVIGVAVLIPLALAAGAIYVAVNAFMVIIGVVARLIGYLAQLGSIITQAQAHLVNALTNMANRTTAIFSGAWNWLYNAGQQIVNGLIAGINNRVQGVINAVSNIGNSITGKVKQILGIRSPSKVMFGFGDNITQGLVNGMNAGMSKVENLATNMAMSVKTPTMPNAQNAPVSNTNTTITMGDINISDKPTADYFFSILNRNNELAKKGLATI